MKVYDSSAMTMPAIKAMQTRESSSLRIGVSSRGTGWWPTRVSRGRGAVSHWVGGARACYDEPGPCPQVPPGTRNSHMKFIPLTWRFRAAAVFACYLLAAGVVGLAGQPPEEEEAPKSKTKKKIVVEDPDPPSGVKSPGGNSPDKRLDELDGAAAAAKNPAVKKLLASYAVPFDRIVEKGETLRIVPIPKHWKKDTFPANSEFPVIPIDGSGKALPARKVSVAKVKSIEPFEQVVQAEVDSWLKQRPVGTGAGPADLSADDQLAAAEKLLAAANRYHDTARETGVRKGKSWDDIHQPLHDRWRDVALEQLTRAVDIADWQRARMHGTRLMIAFPKDPLVAKKVAIA